MKRQAHSQRTPSLTLVVWLLTAFILGASLVGAHSATATAAETGCAKCAGSHDSTVLVGMAGTTLTLLAKEALGLLRIGASTTATVGLALARNLDGIMLWINAVLVAIMSQMTLIVAGAFVLAVIKIRAGRR
jgi:hypothetical protein